MKPILVPILDISYYLPEFSGFDKKKLFRKEVDFRNTSKKGILLKRVYYGIVAIK